MRIILNTVCGATVNETWELEVPDGTEFDDPLDLITGGVDNVEVISCTDEVSDEHDRNVVSYHEEVTV